MAAHTPEPWFVIPDPTGHTILCDVGGPTHGNTTVAENCDPADARLIAASPGLRRFAQEIAEVDLSAMSDAELWDWIHERKSRSRALVAKADGAQ